MTKNTKTNTIKPVTKNMKTNTFELKVLTDKEILEGFRNADNRIIADYFYDYLRLVYYKLDGKYYLREKEGMDFYSLAHEYYLYLYDHDWKPLRKRPASASLKGYMAGGFRFLTLDKLKEIELTGKTVSIGEGAEDRQISFDVPEDTSLADVRDMVEEVCEKLGKDTGNAAILRMLLIEGYKEWEVAEMLDISVSAVSQRYKKLLKEVVAPYFRDHYVSEGGSIVCSSHAMISCKKIVSREEDKLALPLSMPRAKEEYLYKRCYKEIYREVHIEPYDSRVSSSNITRLERGQIFVFGSNLVRLRRVGAARMALHRFGADKHCCVGLKGQSYAIPTMQGGVDTIAPYVNDFINFAKEHTELTFLVTAIGCGQAGFTPEDIAPLFYDAIEVENIHLPKEFWWVLKKKYPYNKFFLPNGEGPIAKDVRSIPKDLSDALPEEENTPKE